MMHMRLAKIHPPVLLRKQVTGLIFIDDLVTSTDLQRVIICLQEFCKQWKLRINLDKTKTVVFKKGRKLSKNKKE
jgi:hypothetical protein